MGNAWTEFERRYDNNNNNVPPPWWDWTPFFITIRGSTAQHSSVRWLYFFFVPSHRHSLAISWTTTTTAAVSIVSYLLLKGRGRKKKKRVAYSIAHCTQYTRRHWPLCCCCSFFFIIILYTRSGTMDRIISSSSFSSCYWEKIQFHQKQQQKQQPPSSLLWKQRRWRKSSSNNSSGSGSPISIWIAVQYTTFGFPFPFFFPFFCFVVVWCLTVAVVSAPPGNWEKRNEMKWKERRVELEFLFLFLFFFPGRCFGTLNLKRTRRDATRPEGRITTSRHHPSARVLSSPVPFRALPSCRVLYSQSVQMAKLHLNSYLLPPSWCEFVQP